MVSRTSRQHVPILSNGGTDHRAVFADQEQERTIILLWNLLPRLLGRLLPAAVPGNVAENHGPDLQEHGPRLLQPRRRPCRARRQNVRTRRPLRQEHAQARKVPGDCAAALGPAIPAAKSTTITTTTITTIVMLSCYCYGDAGLQNHVRPQDAEARAGGWRVRLEGEATQSAVLFAAFDGAAFRRGDEERVCGVYLEY